MTQKNEASQPAVIITGAGSGIGRATAVLLAERGARLALLGRRSQLLEETEQLCRSLGGSAIALPTDIAALQQVQAAVRDAADAFGRIDAVVNNAGVARVASIENSSEADLDMMLATHLRGPILLIQSTLPMLRQNGGSIVNVTSVGGMVATPGRALYGATKAALNHLTRSLAMELAPHVRVNAVLPGPVRTPIYDHLGLSPDEQQQFEQELIRKTPAGRFAEPTEVARWIAHLLEDQWVTGTLLTIDGGRSC